MCGLALGGVALALHALPGGIAQHMATASLIGLGVSSASTVATMFIVEVEPEARWDGLIGRLGTALSGGQLVGLVLAGVLVALGLSFRPGTATVNRVPG